MTRKNISLAYVREPMINDDEREAATYAYSNVKFSNVTEANLPEIAF